MASKIVQLQEYAQAVDVKGLGVPVYNISFPGAAYFAKAGRQADTIMQQH